MAPRTAGGVLPWSSRLRVEARQNLILESAVGDMSSTWKRRFGGGTASTAASAQKFHSGTRFSSVTLYRF